MGVVSPQLFLNRGGIELSRKGKSDPASGICECEQQAWSQTYSGRTPSRPYSIAASTMERFGGQEQFQGLLVLCHVMDTQNLNPLQGEREGDAESPNRSGGVFAPKELGNEAFAGVTYENRCPGFVESSCILDEFDVVFMCFAETDSGIKADPFESDPRFQERFLAS